MQRRLRANCSPVVSLKLLADLVFSDRPDVVFGLSCSYGKFGLYFACYLSAIYGYLKLILHCVLLSLRILSLDYVNVLKVT